MGDMDFIGRLVVWVLGGYLLGTSLIITLEHLRVWRRNQSHLLPLHVWTVAVSFDLLIVHVLTLAGPLDWRAFIYLPGLLLGCISMTILMVHQRLVYGGRTSPTSDASREKS